MNQPAHPAQSDTSRDAPSTTLPVAYTRPMEEPEGRASGESANGESALGVSGEAFRPLDRGPSRLDPANLLLLGAGGRARAGQPHARYEHPQA